MASITTMITDCSSGDFKFQMVIDDPVKLHEYIDWCRTIFDDTTEYQYIMPGDGCRWSFDIEHQKIYFVSDIELFVFSLKWGHY